MNALIDTLVALADGVDSSAVEPFLSEAGGIRVLGYSESAADFRASLAQPSADELAVLGAEIENQNAFSCGR